MVLVNLKIWLISPVFSFSPSKLSPPILYQLPDLNNVVFCCAGYHPRFDRAPRKIGDFVGMATVNKLE
jgi:hypothetical protein